MHNMATVTIIIECGINSKQSSCYCTTPHQNAATFRWQYTGAPRSCTELKL